MACTICDALVVWRTDSHGVAVGRHRNRGAGEVAACFAVDVLAELDPRVAAQPKDAGMTGEGAVAIVQGRTGDHGVAIVGHRNRAAEEVPGGFAVDVLAKLDPAAAREPEDANLAGIVTGVVIVRGADGNGVAVGRDVDRECRIVEGSVAHDGLAELDPIATV